MTRYWMATLVAIAVASFGSWTGLSRAADPARRPTRTPAQAASSSQVATPAKGKSAVSSDRKRFELTETSGPWMIFAASFVGPGAEDDALKLVRELRAKKMDAYIHAQSYDFNQPVEGLGLDPYGKPRKMRYNSLNSYQEYAVLIGDYPSVDDDRLQKTLKALKTLQPKSIGKESTLRFAGLRQEQRNINQSKEKRMKGPLGHAFATPNPLVPPTAIAPAGIDSLVVKMNKGLKYNLLDCKKKYTVRIATFRGQVVIDQKEIKDIEENKEDMSSRLDDAADKANRLVQLLRQQGVEAYQYHDRYASYVTVGSFDSLGVPLEDGATDLDKKIYAVMEKYGPQKKPVVSGNGQEIAMVPQVIGGIHLDVQPYPMDIPRYSIAADYDQSHFR